MKLRDSSVDILNYPARNGQILRNFEIFLPKFHFILPNFYFPVPWRIFVCSLETSDFLRRDWSALYFPLQNAIWSVARPDPDAHSPPRRAGGAGSELPRLARHADFSVPYLGIALIYSEKRGEKLSEPPLLIYTIYDC